MGARSVQAWLAEWCARRRVLWLRARRHALRMLALALLSTGAALLCWELDWLGLADSERGAYDQGLTTFTRQPRPSPHVVVVGIDQASVARIRDNPTYALNFGPYPWSRNLWARVVEQLAHEGARALVLDAVMDERGSDAAADLALAEALRATGLPFYVGISADPGAPPLPPAEPLNPPRAAPALPRPALPGVAAAGEELLFEEADEAQLSPPATPAEAARALAFPVRTEGRPLPALTYEVAPGDRRARHPTPPIAPLLWSAAGFGLVETEADPDARVRRTRFAYTDGTHAYVTLPVAAAADLLGAEALELGGGRLRLGTRTLAVDPDGSAEIDYRGTLEERFEVLPLWALLDAWALRQEGRPGPLPAGLLRGKVVLVGGMAVGLGDVKATPFDAQAPGVSKQAAVLDALLGGRFITRAPLWVSLLLTFGVALLSVALITVVRSTLLEIAWPLALFFGFFLVTGALLRATDVHVLSALPTLAGELASVSAVAFNHLFASRRAQFMREAFSHFMEPQVVEQMLAGRRLPRLEGESREITAFFSDIRGFSAFSEGHFRDDPAALVRFLHVYLTRVSAELLAEGGCLDKYIGDAVVCLFGAPLACEDHALRACRGALRAQGAIRALQDTFRAQGLPDVHTRIGLNSAVMFVGNFGSEQLFDYTAIGDGMNLAARLEGANKAFDSTILMGPRTWELAREGVEARELDRVRVAGKQQVVTVYELLALKGQLSPTRTAVMARYGEALALYRAARFGEAAALLEAALVLDPHDGPARVLRQRCERYRREPPPLPFDAVTNLEK